jgi:transposase InsO family protein
MINEAMDQGARQEQACEVIGISNRTLQHWQQTGLTDQRQQAKKVPVNKLSDEERAAILEVCNSPEFNNRAPKQIVPALADRGLYLASESSFYRILRDADQLQHRGRANAPNRARPEAYSADGPNQVWSWDITYLASNVKGVFFYLYLFMDIYSRKIVGWEVYENESSEQAADVLRKTRLAEALFNQQEVVLHSDNGSPMKGATMLATMQKLGIVPSFSRPSVSNDNPYSESLFKTLKYIPTYPSKPFESVEHSRRWVATFVQWYNHEHHHSGIKYVTPAQRHQGEDKAILEQRKQVYEKAKKQHPERWSGETRNWEHEAMVKLNPVNELLQNTDIKQAA